MLHPGSKCQQGGSHVFFDLHPYQLGEFLDFLPSEGSSDLCLDVLLGRFQLTNCLLIQLNRAKVLFAFSAQLFDLVVFRRDNVVFVGLELLIGVLKFLNFAIQGSNMLLGLVEVLSQRFISTFKIFLFLKKRFCLLLQFIDFNLALH
jgi:hypothetical protein